MVGMKVTINTGDLEKKFQKVAQGDFREPLLKAGALLVEASNKCFRDSVDSDGKPWAPLSPVTIAMRKKGGKSQYGDKILRDSGTLMKSVTFQVFPSLSPTPDSVFNITKTSLEFGTNLPYAFIHQYGGVKKWGKRYVNIPKRSFLGVNETTGRYINQAFSDWFKEVFSGA